MISRATWCDPDSKGLGRGLVDNLVIPHYAEVLSRFIDDRFDREPSATITPDELYIHHRRWAAGRKNRDSVPREDFEAALAEIGFELNDSAHYIGLRLKKAGEATEH